MGYRHKIPRVNVKFDEGHEYHGCEVVLRKLTLGEYLDIAGLNPDSGILNVGDQLRKMGDKLISWNLEDEDTGEPIPATPQAILDQDKDLMVAVLSGWLDGVNGVSAPLEQASPDGQQSPVESIPMETLSNALVS
jgi:hypothetical protein